MYNNGTEIYIVYINVICGLTWSPLIHGQKKMCDYFQFVKFVFAHRDKKGQKQDLPIYELFSFELPNNYNRSSNKHVNFFKS